MIARGRWLEALLAAVATLVAAWPVAGLFVEQPWVGPTVVVLAVIAVAGALARSARLPGWAVVGVQVALAALTISWVLLPGHHRYGVPQPTVLDAVVGLWQEALVSVRTDTVPAQAGPEMVLLVVLGLTAVGLAVDAAAVTARSPALAGLPLLVVCTVTASNTGEPLHPRYFLATAVVWLLMLARQGTGLVRSWPEEPGADAPRSSVAVGPAVAGTTRRYTARARTLGAATVALAVLLPGVLPHLPPTTVVDGLARAGGPGTGGITFTETMDLSADLGSRSRQPVLRYRTDDVRPPPLRVTVTPRYEDGRWQPDERDRAFDAPLPEDLAPLPLLLGMSADVEYTEQSLTVLENDLLAPQVAVPDRFVGADFGEIGWSLDAAGAVLVDEQPPSYEATYWQVQTAQPLPAGVGSPLPDVADAGLGDDGAPDGAPEMLQLPEPAQERVRALTAELVAGTGNDLDAAKSIQAYLRGAEFSYSLTLAEPVAGPDGEPLDPVSHFLETKVGYCTQFASAMVMMARAHGIPARLAVGFLPGELQADGSRTVVAADAHAWPELFISGLGWTRFEPTPGARSGSAPTYFTESDVAGGTEPAPDPTVAAPPVDTEPRNLGRDPVSTGGTSPGPTGRDAAPVLLALVVLAALLSVVPAAGAWRRRSGLRRATGDVARVEGQWQRLTVTLGDLGVPEPVGTTPRQAGTHLAEAAGLDDSAAAALTRAVRRLEQARYAPGGAEPGTMAQDVDHVLDRARHGLPRRRRVRIALWPRSGTDQLSDVAARLAAAVRGWSPSRRTLPGRRWSPSRRRVGVPRSSS